MKEISILIPTYNHVCVALVSVLRQQALAAGVIHEVIVADDGSTQRDTVEANRAINEFPCCRYMERPQNV
jgi:glycosyltransferase involved in cell wall biosynthesis